MYNVLLLEESDVDVVEISSLSSLLLDVLVAVGFGTKQPPKGRPIPKLAINVVVAIKSDDPPPTSSLGWISDNWIKFPSSVNV